MDVNMAPGIWKEEEKGENRNVKKFQEDTKWGMNGSATH